MPILGSGPSAASLSRHRAAAAGSAPVGLPSRSRDHPGRLKSRRRSGDIPSQMLRKSVHRTFLICLLALAQEATDKRAVDDPAVQKAAKYFNTSGVKSIPMWITSSAPGLDKNVRDRVIQHLRELV